MSTNTIITRDQVPLEYTWNLSSIYATDADWETEFAAVSARMPQLAQFSGKLKSAKSLAQALAARDIENSTIGKLHAYASMRSDEDKTNGFYQDMYQRIGSLYNDFAAVVSYMHPQMLKLPESKLSGWSKKSKALIPYQREIAQLIRDKPHYASEAVEAKKAEAEELDNAESIYSALVNADLKFPNFVDDQGNSHSLTQKNWPVHIESSDRSVRKGAFESMMGTFGSFQNTFAATYAAQVKASIFRSKGGNFAGNRARALFNINVPESLYDALIDTVHLNLPKLHRSMAIRRKELKLSELHFYDLYCPLDRAVADSFKMSYKEACELVLKAVAPLGEEYVSVLRKGLLELRWADVLPNKGKRNGAYSGGEYLTDPFMLLNWQETLDAIYTLAHEAGHSMHSWFTRRNQPYQTGDYTIFVAEVASTCNEALLTQYLLRTYTDKNIRKYILTHAMEAFRGTLYRQTLFAEFELLAHGKAEEGTPLTPKLLNEIHLSLNQKYYGAEMVVDDLLQYEWMRIPHFYSPFYVWQYCTGISAGTALAAQILKEGQPAVERYLRCLKSGSSQDSLDLLRGAGVDLSTAAPIQAGLDVFESYIDAYEAA
jgi:oligoendopeptidase F